MTLFSSSGPNPLPSTLAKKAFYPVDNSPLITFRIIFGFLLFYHTSKYILSGSVYQIYIQPPFTFTFIGFEFLQPLPGFGMYYYFGLMALFALCIMFGAWYRFSIIGFTALWACIYLMQKSGYNNHYYLILLLCFVMMFTPAHRYYSWDVKRGAVSKQLSCPQWVAWLFIAQMSIVYVYAAIAKLNPDWLSGRFIKIRFSYLSHFPLIARLYSHNLFQSFIIYGGILFDLLIAPLLLWKKTRRFAFFVSCIFHLFNAYSFRIGIFPYLSIALNMFFLDPEKVRGFFFKNKRVFALPVNAGTTKTHLKRLILYGIFIYIFIQLVLPMRSWFYPGTVFWNEEGYRMSWKMMLRAKTGEIKFKVIDPASGKTWNIDPAKKFSVYHVKWLAIQPDIIWQYAQRLKKEFASKGFDKVEVYAIGSVSLNRRPPRPLVDSSVNLAAVKWHPFKHSEWIMPFAGR